MIGHVPIQLAMRAQLLLLNVCTTTPTTLSATANGYARTSGSFLTDGFAPGMEVTPVSFVSNPVQTILGISADGLNMMTSGRSVEAAAANRTLSVVLPASRAWEDDAFKPTAGVPFVEEQYLRGPEYIENDGLRGLLVMEPMYQVKVWCPQGYGILADGRYADAIRLLFGTGLRLPLPAPDTCEVRGDQAPFGGQRVPRATGGWFSVPITIPFRVRTITDAALNEGEVFDQGGVLL